MRVPFDSLCLAAVVDECQRLVGGRVQRVLQWDSFTIGLGVYRDTEEWLLLSCDPQYARIHLAFRREAAPKEPPSFCRSLRKHISDARIEFILQRGLDRVLDIGLSTEAGDLQLVAEIMGKHSNIVLVGLDRKVLSSAKVVGDGKSKRPVVPGRAYEPPPFEPRRPFTEAEPTDDLKEFEGASPFLRTLITSGVSLASVKQAVVSRAWETSYADGHGAYPLSLLPLFDNSVPRESISQAIEQSFAAQMEAERFSVAKSSMAAQLQRVMDARNRALGDLQEAIDTASRARELQEMGELILAYQHTVKPGDRQLVVPGYDGEDLTIALNPEKSALDNAQRLFAKAKRAKEGAAEVSSQIERLSIDQEELASVLLALEGAKTLEEVERVRSHADGKRWLHHHVEPKSREDRPYEGHSVRELVSPGGWKVLYGENATSNDYLTTKVARSNDYWFHVRGVTSAHVLLQTHNQPTKVQKEDLLFAAKVAVSKSSSKHSSYVTVDYTLKKYVRKPRKSAPGLVTYSGEKTLHIEQ